MKVSKRFVIYMLVGLATALFIEWGAARSGDSQLFKSPVWPIGFLIWYGLLYLLSYKFMRHWKLWQIGLFWALAGPVIEIVLFRGSFLLTDIFYSLMFMFPFWVIRKFA